MDKNKAHDVVHTWYGGKSENCPHCCGTMDEKATKAEAAKIAQENYKPRTNPQVSFESRLYAYADNDGNMPDTITSESVALRNIESDLRPMIDIVAFGEGKEDIPTKIKVLPIGKYKMSRYGEVVIDEKKIKDMVKHFNENVRASSATAGLPIDIEHGTTSHKDAAAGWLKKLFAEKDGLYAEVEWTELGKDLLKKRIYKFYSPEFWFDYEDAENIDIKLQNVMTGGGLVNKPMLKHDLKPLVNSEKGNENNHLTDEKKTNTIFLELTNSLQNDGSEKQVMKLSEILAKPANERSSEEQKFLNDHKDELTFAEAKKEGFATDKEVKANENTNTANQVTLAEGQRVVDGKKFDELTQLAEKGATAHAKLEKAELKEKVKAAVFSEKGTKLPTDQIDTAVDLLLTMSEESREKYLAQLKALPEKQLFSETGADNAQEKSAAGEELNKEIHKYMEDHKVSYAVAASAVTAANPTQLKEYQENRPVAGVER